MKNHSEMGTLGGGGAGDGPQDEAGGDGDDVVHRDVLEPEVYAVVSAR